MPSALTAVQIEILRCLRDGQAFPCEPRMPGLLEEISFLASLGLLEVREPLVVDLTALGRSYLAASEDEQASLRQTERGPAPPSDT
jgi:hypothetical protein